MNTTVRSLISAIALAGTVLATGVASATSIGPVTSASLNGFSGTAESGAPTVYASDDFSGNAGSTLGGRALTVGGSAWSVAAGTWTIDGADQATNHGVPLGRVIAPTGHPDARIIVTVVDGVQGGRTSGVVMRSDPSASTFLSAFTSDALGGQISIAKRQGGASTTLATVSGVALTSPATFVVELHGDNIKVVYDGTTSINYTLTASDQATFGRLGDHGLLNDDASTVSYDDFRVEAL